jgi:uncharacterized protein YrzB (UPF0473 family)
MSNEEMKNEITQEEEKTCQCGCNHDGHHDHDDCDCEDGCSCEHDHDEELPMLGIMDEEGNEHFYACLDEFEKAGKQYIITMELDMDEKDEEGVLADPFENDELEVIVFVDEGEEDGERIVSVVENDEEFNGVIEEWNGRIEAEKE